MGRQTWKSSLLPPIVIEMGLLLYTMVLVTLITILWRVSSIARYYLKYIYFGLASCFLASAPIPLMLLRPKDSRNALIPAAGIRWCCRLIGVTISLEGHENIVKDSGCVVLINHQSMLDLLVLAELWPAMENCTVISKKEILYFQPFGLAAWLWGTIFIDRVKKENAQAAVNKTGETIKARKARVLMFPEGTRNFTEKLLPFKKGAFHVAVASQCPIQPVVVGRYRFLGKHKFDGGHIKIKILPPISTDGYTPDNMEELMEKAYKIMTENVDLISKEVDNKSKKD